MPSEGNSTDKPKKWPKEVILAQDGLFDRKCFFWWSFEQSSSSYWGLIILVAVIGLFLFPIWPMKLKIWSFYFSLYMLILIVSAILRN